MSGAAYLGVIVANLDEACAWYMEELAGVPEDGSGAWATLVLPNGSRIELVVGDPDRPGLAFPSYGAEAGPSTRDAGSSAFAG